MSRRLRHITDTAQFAAKLPDPNLILPLSSQTTIFVGLAATIASGSFKKPVKAFDMSSVAIADARFLIGIRM